LNTTIGSTTGRLKSGRLGTRGEETQRVIMKEMKMNLKKDSTAGRTKRRQKRTRSAGSRFEKQ